MLIATRMIGATYILDVNGDITLYNSPEIRKALMDVLKVKRARALAVNMTKVRYIDSAGVACLVEALKVSRELGSSLMLFGLSPVAREVLELTRLIRVFEVHDTEQAALEVMEKSSSSASA